MDRIPGRWNWTTGVAFFIALQIALAGAFSCARKGTSARASGATRSGASERDRNFVVPLKEQIRWNYPGSPTPALSKTPSYRLRNFNFAEGSSELDAEAKGVCREFASMMKERPLMRVLLLGLTDAYGEKMNAENLGMLRARAARDFLVQQGVTKDRLDTATYGEKLAAAKPDEKIAQSQDRRVEVWLIEE